MIFKGFCNAMLKKSKKNGEKAPSLDELEYMYKKYLITRRMFKETEDEHKEEEALKFKSFYKLSNKERLRYREKCANEGIEFTPYQINLYINVLCIIGEEYLDYSDGS
jgi:hypothetical protein